MLVGRCSQDGGAPALWPWQQVLAQLGEELEEGGEEDEGAEFRVRERLARRVADAAVAEPLLLVLEDLHWADVASLRVLRMLVDTVALGRLLVLATWRSHPEPTGALADVAESLARRHADRLELTGLGAGDVAAVVGSVASVVPDDEQSPAGRPHRRQPVLPRRVRPARPRGRRPHRAARRRRPADRRHRRALAPAGAAARRHPRAAALGGGARTAVPARRPRRRGGPAEDDVLDRLDPAVDAGLVREVGADGFSFAHALVRDTVTAATSPARLARAHARVAEVLEARPGRESEVARHWRAAGPAYTGRAWRAAAAAAAVARRRHASDAAVELLHGRLDAVVLDPDATPRDRYELLMELAEVHRWTGDWLSLVEVVEAAIGVADEIGDVRLLARPAAVSPGVRCGSRPATATSTTWSSTPCAAPRRAPDEDSELRCRVLLALSTELYYRVGPRSARRWPTPAWRWPAGSTTPSCWCRPARSGWSGRGARHRAARVAVAEEGVRLARELGHERSYVACLTLLAIALGELGSGPASERSWRSPSPRPVGCTCPTRCWCWRRWTSPGWPWLAGSRRSTRPSSGWSR